MKNTRVTIDLSPKAVEQLKAIKCRVNNESTAAVFRDALRLYDWFTSELAKGTKFQKIIDDEVTEIEFLL